MQSEHEEFYQFLAEMEPYSRDKKAKDSEGNDLLRRLEVLLPKSKNESWVQLGNMFLQNCDP